MIASISSAAQPFGKGPISQERKTSFQSALAAFQNLEKEKGQNRQKIIAAKPAPQQTAAKVNIIPLKTAAKENVPPLKTAAPIQTAAKASAAPQKTAAKVNAPLQQTAVKANPIPQETAAKASAAPQKTEAEEIKARSGHLWECISRKPGQYGGFIYRFKVRPEYDDLTPGPNHDKNVAAIEAKKNEIFPAVESSPIEFVMFDTKRNKQEIIDIVSKEALRSNAKIAYESLPLFIRICISEEEFIKSAEESVKKEVTQSIDDLMKVAQFGYELQCEPDGIYLNLPDREALMGFWKEKYPNLPGLDIIDSEGIAGDLEFVEAYLNHGALMSKGQEFCHDVKHIQPYLHDRLKYQMDYKEQRAEITQNVQNSYNKIMKAEGVFPELKPQFTKIEAVLGAKMDTLAAADLKNAKTLISAMPAEREFFTGIWNDAPGWSDYLKKRFGEVDVTEISALWDKIEMVGG